MSKIPINMPADMVEGSECLANEVPWMVPEAIYKLDELLNEKDNVLEAGSGGSTLFFARRCRDVVSLETSNEWAKVVDKKIENIHNAVVISGLDQKNIESFVSSDSCLSMRITVFSVDTQGGFNRSIILNAFLKNPASRFVRMIILDNYGHEGLFPDHWDKFDCGFHDWTVMTFDHPRWAGSGTKILLKP